LELSKEYKMAVCDYCNKEMRRAYGCTLSVFDDYPGGKPITRIRYGDEREDWGAKSGKRCGDCGCKPGYFHHPGCDIECCPVCSGQAFSCNCVEDETDEIVSFTDDPDHDVWLPIEKFFGGCGVPEVEAFMFMHTTRNQEGSTVWAYKHCDTRRYMWLDAFGHPYRTCDWDSKTLTSTSRNTAMAMAYDGIDEGLFLSRPGSAPRYEIFPLKRNAPGAA
jgi:hypothetical protein